LERIPTSIAKVNKSIALVSINFAVQQYGGIKMDLKILLNLLLITGIVAEYQKTCFIEESAKCCKSNETSDFKCNENSNRNNKTCKPIGSVFEYFGDSRFDEENGEFQFPENDFSYKFNDFCISHYAKNARYLISCEKISFVKKCCREDQILKLEENTTISCVSASIENEFDFSKRILSSCGKVVENPKIQYIQSQLLNKMKNILEVKKTAMIFIDLLTGPFRIFQNGTLVDSRDQFFEDYCLGIALQFGELQLFLVTNPEETDNREDYYATVNLVKRNKENISNTAALLLFLAVVVTVCSIFLIMRRFSPNLYAFITSYRILIF
jgi:hypothetical protein